MLIYCIYCRDWRENRTNNEITKTVLRENPPNGVCQKTVTIAGNKMILPIESAIAYENKCYFANFANFIS